jgi:hypothetical protein
MLNMRDVEILRLNAVVRAKARRGFEMPVVMVLARDLLVWGFFLGYPRSVGIIPTRIVSATASSSRFSILD